VAPESGRPKRGLGRLLLTVVAGVAVAAMAFYFIGFGKAAPPPKPVLVNLGTFITNLDDPAVEHYIKVSVSVLVPSAGDARLLGQDNTSVQNDILAALQGTSVNEALGSGAIASVSSLVRRAIQKGAPGVRVLKVYFTQFIVE
jgi:flagellar basal body-associated protein FliL